MIDFTRKAFWTPNRLSVTHFLSPNSSFSVLLVVFSNLFWQNIKLATQCSLCLHQCLHVWWRKGIGDCVFLWNIKSLKCARQHRYVNILIYQIRLTSKLNIDRAADITIAEIKQKDSLRNLIEIHTSKNIYCFY